MNVTGTMEKLNRIQGLAESGRNAAIVAELGALPAPELERSPALALMFGLAQGRLGQHAAGRQWVSGALESARAKADAATTARSLNVLGAIAFEEGMVADAEPCFMAGLAEAERQGDRATAARCSNNLGILSNLRGDHGRAIGCYTVALAAFQQVGPRCGVGETLHNLAITYRDQRAFKQALATEERAAREAKIAGDLALAGLIHCGRGEILLAGGEIERARQEIQRALDLHREVGDQAGEAEDLRALAETLRLSRQAAQREAMLRDVVERAQHLGKMLLTAQAERDLARLLHRQKRDAEATSLAQSARQRFAALGAVYEMGRLDGLLRETDA